MNRRNLFQTAAAAVGSAMEIKSAPKFQGRTAWIGELRRPRFDLQANSIFAMDSIIPETKDITLDFGEWALFNSASNAAVARGTGDDATGDGIQ